MGPPYIVVSFKTSLPPHHHHTHPIEVFQLSPLGLYPLQCLLRPFWASIHCKLFFFWGGGFPPASCSLVSPPLQFLTHTPLRPPSIAISPPPCYFLYCRMSTSRIRAFSLVCTLCASPLQSLPMKSRFPCLALTFLQPDHFPFAYALISVVFIPSTCLFHSFFHYFIASYLIYIVIALLHILLFSLHPLPFFFSSLNFLTIIPFFLTPSFSLYIFLSFLFFSFWYF